MKGVNIADMPQTAVDLVDLIGLPATVRLIESMPGILFPVPKGFANNQAGAGRYDYLVEACGRRAAKVLVKHYGGTNMYVPSCKSAMLRARDRQIVAEYNDGSTVMDLALRWKLSYRQIETILSRTDMTEPASCNQVELF